MAPDSPQIDMIRDQFVSCYPLSLKILAPREVLLKLGGYAKCLRRKQTRATDIGDTLKNIDKISISFVDGNNNEFSHSKDPRRDAVEAILEEWDCQTELTPLERFATLDQWSAAYGLGGDIQPIDMNETLETADSWFEAILDIYWKQSLTDAIVNRWTAIPETAVPETVPDKVTIGDLKMEQIGVNPPVSGTDIIAGFCDQFASKYQSNELSPFEKSKLLEVELQREAFDTLSLLESIAIMLELSVTYNLFDLGLDTPSVRSEFRHGGWNSNLSQTILPELLRKAVERELTADS